MHRISKYVSGLISLLAVILLLGVAGHAYTTYARWPSSPVLFYTNPNNADVDASATETALRAAMDAWNTQGGSPFRYSYVGRVNDTTTGYDSRNVILFRNATNGSAIASTYSWYSGTTLVDADIVFWDASFTFVAGAQPCSGGAYIEDVATHELGHALGLLHSTVGDATMYPSYSMCSQEMRTLAADDSAGVQNLYGSQNTTNRAPSVTITGPSNNASFTEGAAISFAGSASDPEDGNLTSSLTWRSSVSGQIGTGASFAVALPTGTHVVTATAVDSGTLSASRQVTITVTPRTNTAPSVTINSPSNNASVTEGTAVSFSGSASDTEDGNLTSSLTWRSSVSGQIGTGASFAVTLPTGTHVVTATAVDSGTLSASRQVTITVTAPRTNTAPSVTINSPSNNASVTEGTAVSFSGSASDTEDGNLTSSLTWRSSVSGQIGTGASFTLALPAGTHVITATVADSGALSASRQVTVTVVPAGSTPPPTAGATLSARAFKAKGLNKVDLTWSGLSGTGSVDIYRGGAIVMSTPNDGSETDPLDKRGNGSSIKYRVCASGSSTCTNEVTVSF